MRRHLALIVLALALAGCHSTPPTPEKMAEYDYRLKHPVVVEPRLAALHLAAEGAAGLAEADRRRLVGFAAEFLRRGSGLVEISVGAARAEDAAARLYGQQIATGLMEAGLKPRELRLQLVIDEPAIGPGSAFLRYTTSAVQLPDCYDWSTGERNAPEANFGCAIQRNMGAMLANPRDLVESRPADLMPGLRSDQAIDKANQGGNTWSAPLPWSANSKSGGQ